MDSYVGKRLDGRYEIRDIIGVGGMAVVYKAYDNIDDRIVAIKILKEEFLANEEFRRRFKNESKAIAVLSHPNIVKVYDVSLGDKLQYIVMEYVQGITLKEYIEQQKVIDWKEAVHFTTQILRALQHAHDKGIVHRDIKPQNIMLLEDGTIKVTDFGIARFSRGETRTMTAAAIGSVHYISPEQARGEVTDAKADIYSVGVVLYEMITGELPFESDSAVSVALMQLQDEATPPRQINPNIPIGLEQITLHAMEKNTRDRYQSAAEMLLDLDELRRNPSVKFDYSYFVDKEPTKFITRDSTTGGISTTVPGSTTGTPAAATTGNSKKKVWIAVLVSLAVIGIVILCLALFTNVFHSGNVTVPNFLGMNYENDIKENSKYSDFEFEVSYVTSTSGDEGQVTKQSPSAGSSVSSGTTIKLEVVSSGTTEKIPDIYGVDVDKAETMLKEAGFTKITITTQSAGDSEPGTVIKSDPEQGTEADVTATVILYVADENGNVTVPDLSGTNYYTDESAVSKALEDVGLSVGTVTEEDSDETKGTIISQSPKANTKAEKKSKVNIVVSSGAGSENTGTVTITLPSTGDDASYKLYVNNELVKSTTVLCNGGSHSESVTASGSNVSIDVYLDSQKIYVATGDFTNSPATFSNVQTYEYVTSSSGGSLFGLIGDRLNGGRK